MTLSATHLSTTDRLREVHNGQRIQGAFTAAEYDRRLSGLRSAMARADIEAAVLTSYQTVLYYSGFLQTRFGRPYALVVTSSTATTISAGIDAGMPWRSSMGENIVYTDWQRDNFEFAVNTALSADGAGRGRLGIEDDEVPLALRARLAAQLPEATFTDIAEISMRQRMFKSAEEIAVITEGARIGDLGGAAVVEAMAVGVPEYEVALAGTAAMTRAIAQSFPNSEVRDTWIWFQGGINTDGAHNWPTTRPLQRGDLCSMNCFPMTAGYYTALERTLVLGEADEAQLRYWNTNVAVHRRGLELIKPGAVCKDIANELNEMFAAEGMLELRTFGYGHSFGALSHYYGREAGLELREDVETVIEPGMVVSMEPMITVPEGQPGAGGYREHDILVVREDGVENITKFPFGPEHNIVG